MRPSLGSIASVFARYANTTFGGGSATIAVLRRQIVEHRAWVEPSEFELAYALSRLTPGTNLLAFCTASGWIARRGRGAIVALLAASLPCSILAVLITVFYDQLHGNVVFEAALAGALAAAVSIMAATAWVFAEPHVRAAPWKAAIIVPGTVAIRLGAQLSPIAILAIAAVVGLAWPVAKPEPPP